jgi:hypothetical protein
MADNQQYVNLYTRGQPVRQPSSGGVRPGISATAIVLAGIALVIAIIAMILALWKWGYWDYIESSSAVHTSRNVIVDGWIETLIAYMISGIAAVRYQVINLLPSPDLALIYGNLGITANLQEASNYFLWSSAEPTTLPNNWFIDSYIQQIDSVFGTIGLNFFTMNGYWFMSDSDYKVNVSDINGTAALEILRAIDPSTFFWADDTQQTIQYGFIAQNVNDSFPEAVQVFGGAGATNGTLGVSAVALLSQLWAAVKELDKQINP